MSLGRAFQSARALIVKARSPFVLSGTLECHCPKLEVSKSDILEPEGARPDLALKVISTIPKEMNGLELQRN